MSKVTFLFVSIYLGCLIVRPQEFMAVFAGIPLLAIIEVIALVSWLRDSKTLRHPTVAYLVLLNFVIFASLFFVSPSYALSESILYFLTILLMFLLVSNAVDTAARQLLVVKLIVLCTVVLCLHGVHQHIDPNHTGWTGQQAIYRTDSATPIWQVRYIGIFSDPNDLGMLLTASIPLTALLFSLAPSRWRRLFYLGALGLILYTIYLTNSRGTILAVGVVLAVWFWYRYGTTRTALLCGLALPALAVLAPSRFSNLQDESSLGRVEAWYEGLQMWKSSPFFGVGKGQFVEYHGLTAHNSWVLALAELGTLGYIAWTGFLFTSLIYAYRLSSTPVSKMMKAGVPELRAKTEVAIAKALFAGLMASCTAMMFLSRTYTQLMYLICALIIGQAFRVYRMDSELMPARLWPRVLLASFASAGVIVLAMLVLL